MVSCVSLLCLIGHGMFPHCLPWIPRIFRRSPLPLSMSKLYYLGDGVVPQSTVSTREYNGNPSIRIFDACPFTKALRGLDHQAELWTRVID